MCTLSDNILSLHANDSLTLTIAFPSHTNSAFVSVVSGAIAANYVIDETAASAECMEIGNSSGKSDKPAAGSNPRWSSNKFSMLFCANCVYCSLREHTKQDRRLFYLFRSSNPSIIIETPPLKFHHHQPPTPPPPISLNWF